jgi:hypothetical protein
MDRGNLLIHSLTHYLLTSWSGIDTIVNDSLVGMSEQLVVLLSIAELTLVQLLPGAPTSLVYFHRCLRTYTSAVSSPIRAVFDRP